MTNVLDRLPGNASPLEETLATMLDTGGRYFDRLADIMELGKDIDTIPDDWLPWFIFNEGLSVLLPYLPMREVLREGRPWLKELGSEAAILRALGWVGQIGVTVHYEPDADEHFDLFQVELRNPVTSLADAAVIANLIVLSKASTDILGRVRAGIDGNAFRLDHSLLDGPDLLDDWTGTRIPGLGPNTPDGPITWSFGSRTVIHTSGGSVSVHIRTTETVCMIEQPQEGFRLDGSILDDERLEPPAISIQVAVTGTATLRSDGRQASWPHRPYPGYSPRDFAPVCSLIIRED
jgi:Phage tail protein (Tail_P2_I).